jgi:ribose 5-phosphate isomerase B
MGAFEFNEDDDYPDFISKAAEKVSQNPDNSKAIIMGGSGQGEAMVCNRFSGIRAAVFYGPAIPKIEGEFAGTNATQDPFEIVRLEREHNNANILSLGTAFLSEEDAQHAVSLFLETSFSGGRHKRRIAMF